MSSNSQRVKKQLLALPAAFALMAVILWPASWMAAQATGWISAPTGAFTDFWLGATSVVTFLGAAGTTIAAGATAVDSLWSWFQD